MITQEEILKYDLVVCEDCGQYERRVWAEADKHQCGKLTDIDMPILDNLVLRIGKKRFLNVHVK